jgi:hypothetical protein
MTRFTAILLALLVAVPACRDARGSQKLQPSGLTPKHVAAKSADSSPHPIETTYDKMLANRAENEAAAAVKANDANPDWVPNEFKSGAAKWKDVGVYVDGKPMGFLTWGELPISLPVTWVEDEVSAEKEPGTDQPATRKVKQRFYRFDQYLKAIGVDIRQIKALHVYGPKFTASNVSTAKDLLSPAAKDFTFRFGANVGGKPIPHVPGNFGNGKSSDKIAGVMVYIHKKPPTLDPDRGFVLDGVEQDGVPYYGDPVRGGVRVYLDDKLVAIIKRQELDGKRATKAADGTLYWKLVDELKLQGVDTSKVKEVWAIRDDLRKEHWAGTELPTMVFGANAQSKGGVLLTDKNVRANVIAMHTRTLKPEEIPAPTPDDD